MLCHTRILILFLFIIVFILTVISLIFHWLIFWKVRAKITVLTVRIRAIIITIILSVIVSSSSIRSKDKSCWMLIIRWCCNVNVDYVTKIAKNVVQEVKMFTKLIKILLHDFELFIQCVRYEIQCILMNSTIISLTLLTSVWVGLSVRIRILSSSLFWPSLWLLSSILLEGLISILVPCWLMILSLSILGINPLILYSWLRPILSSV